MHEQTPKQTKPRKKLFAGKRFRFGTYAVIATVLVIAIVILVNLAVKAVEDKWALRLDLSYNSLTKFTDTTKTALSELDKDVHFYVLAAPGSENPQMMQVLERYRAASEHVHLETIDPDKNPGFINRFREDDTSSVANSVIVTNADETRYKLLSYYDLVDIRADQNTQQYYIASYRYERMFTQSMQYVVADQTPTAYFTQGHGEPTLDTLAALTTLLQDNNYDVQTLELADEMPDPHANVLVVVSPQKDLDERDREKYMGFLENGGSLLYVCDVITPTNLTNFDSILQVYGVGFEEGMVVANVDDTSQYFYAPTNILSALEEHEITTPLMETNKTAIISAQSRAIKLPDMDRNDFAVTPLLKSASSSFLADINATRASWARMDDEPAGSYPLAVAVERRNYTDPSKESRVVLVGSSLTVASSDLLNSFYNGEFVISTFRWLAKDEASDMAIVSKTATRSGLKITSQSQLYIVAAIAIGALPLILLVVGLIVCMRRRHL